MKNKPCWNCGGDVNANRYENSRATACSRCGVLIIHSIHPGRVHAELFEYYLPQLCEATCSVCGGNSCDHLTAKGPISLEDRQAFIDGVVKTQALEVLP